MKTSILFLFVAVLWLSAVDAHRISRNKIVIARERTRPGALGYCGFQLRPRTEGANKIIIIGDGFDSTAFRPRFVAKRILAENIDIRAVSAGPSDIDGLNAITGDEAGGIL